MYTYANSHRHYTAPEQFVYVIEAHPAWFHFRKRELERGPAFFFYTQFISSYLAKNNCTKTKVSYCVDTFGDREK